MSSYSYSRSGRGGGGASGGARSISMRELRDMSFEQLVKEVEDAAAAAAPGNRAFVAAASAAASAAWGPGSDGGGSSRSAAGHWSPPLLPPLAVGGRSGRSTSPSPSLQLPSWDPHEGEGGGALSDWAHFMRDAASAFNSAFPFEGRGISPHRSGPRGRGGRSPVDSSRQFFPWRSSSFWDPRPPELHELLDVPGRRPGSGGGGASGSRVAMSYSRPYTPAAASEGGRSGLPYDYDQLLVLDEGRVRRGVRPEVVRGLPTRAAQRSDAAQQCPVCQERLTPSLAHASSGGRTNPAAARTLTTLPCAHVFCSDCIRPWLITNTTCPVCRWAFPERQTALVAAVDAAT